MPRPQRVLTCSICEQELPAQEPVVIHGEQTTNMFGGTYHRRYHSHVRCYQVAHSELFNGEPEWADVWVTNVEKREGSCSYCRRTLYSGWGGHRRGYDDYCDESCKRREYYYTTQVTLHPCIDCAHCGEEFSPARSDSKFCSGRCRTAAHRQRKKENA